MVRGELAQALRQLDARTDPQRPPLLDVHGETTNAGTLAGDPVEMP